MRCITIVQTPIRGSTFSVHSAPAEEWLGAVGEMLPTYLLSEHRLGRGESRASSSASLSKTSLADGKGRLVKILASTKVRSFILRF
ncbi:hypothetical protein RRG08_005435 [Elysia crispata]|uniref:Uncharacterized protein n=1 Tax=Elysia crispata TaxID=231223 RepID=A0AAE0Y0U0_9GAST|nr:hypothetical protein RRG08_005435 [Elysia crispata]